MQITFPTHELSILLDASNTSLSGKSPTSLSNYPCSRGKVRNNCEYSLAEKDKVIVKTIRKVWNHCETERKNPKLFLDSISPRMMIWWFIPSTLRPSTWTKTYDKGKFWHQSLGTPSSQPANGSTLSLEFKNTLSLITLCFFCAEQGVTVIAQITKIHRLGPFFKKRFSHIWNHFLI